MDEPRDSAAPEAGERPDGRERHSYSFWRWLVEIAVLVAVAFAIAFLLKTFVVQPFYIPSGSMEPTLEPGDRILVNRFVYRFQEPRPGDVVVFIAPHDPASRDFIKRVVAVGGQSVEVRAGELYVDGKKLREPYVAQVPDRSSYGPVRVPADAVFVMGDNRTNSSDSRVFGPLASEDIVGKAFLIYWPPGLEPGQARVL